MSGSRRSHAKTRNACGQCKKRRVRVGDQSHEEGDTFEKAYHVSSVISTRQHARIVSVEENVAIIRTLDCRPLPSARRHLHAGRHRLSYIPCCLTT